MKVKKLYLFVIVSSVLAGRFSAAQPADDVQAIKDAYAGIKVAVENEDIDSLMSYFSADFLHNGYHSSRQQNEFQDLFDSYQNIHVEFTDVQVSVEGDTATTTFHVMITAEPQGGGISDTLEDEDVSDGFANYWIKAGGIWKIHGNQKRSEVDVDTKYWEGGFYQLRITADAVPDDISSITISGPSYLDTATVNKPGEPSSSDDPKRLYDDGEHWDGSANDGVWWLILNIDATPTLTDTISFSITYSDSTTETKQKTIDGVFSETATLVSPPDGSTIDTLTPTFEWTNLSIPVAGYSVQIEGIENRVYEVYNLPDGTTSHTIPSGYLSWGTMYGWLISASDTNGNEALTAWDIFAVSSAPLETTIDILPNTISIKTKSITCHIWPPEGYDVTQIDQSSIRLEGSIEPLRISVRSKQQMLVVKFPTSGLPLEPGPLELTVSGELTDGIPFEDSDTVEVIERGGKPS